VAVGQWDARDLAVPVFVTSVSGNRFRVGALNDSVLPGMPLFDLDGALFAIAAGARHEGAAFPVRDAANRLIALATDGQRQASFGVSLQRLAGGLAEVFGDAGVLISDVVAGGPADLAGIEAGDVLLGVGDTDVDSPETAAAALGSAAVATETTLRMRRDGRARAVVATPAQSYAVASLALTRADDAGPEARALFPAPLLHRAGVPATARVLSVNGRAVTTRAQAERELRRSPQVALLVRHDGHQFFAAIDTAP
jgi:C-terminal processing protease CtpA/Prc